MYVSVYEYDVCMSVVVGVGVCGICEYVYVSMRVCLCGVGERSVKKREQDTLLWGIHQRLLRHRFKPIESLFY